MIFYHLDLFAVLYTQSEMLSLNWKIKYFPCVKTMPKADLCISAFLFFQGSCFMQCIRKVQRKDSSFHYITEIEWKQITEVDKDIFSPGSMCRGVMWSSWALMLYEYLGFHLPFVSYHTGIFLYGRKAPGTSAAASSWNSLLPDNPVSIWTINR